MNSSILINNVEIFDGTNEATVRGNVLVKNGLIEKITQESVPVDPGGDTIVLFCHLGVMMVMRLTLRLPSCITLVRKGMSG